VLSGHRSARAAAVLASDRRRIGRAAGRLSSRGKSLAKRLAKSLAKRLAKSLAKRLAKSLARRLSKRLAGDSR